MRLIYEARAVDTKQYQVIVPYGSYIVPREECVTCKNRWLGSAATYIYIHHFNSPQPCLYIIQ